MVKSEHPGQPCKDCYVHEKVISDAEEGHEQRKKLFDLVGNLQTTKASSGQMWKVLTVFLIISMGVVGWLWHSQVVMGDKIIARLDKDSEKRDLMISSVNDLKTEVILVKERVNTHIEQWPRMPLKNSEHPSPRTGN